MANTFESGAEKTKNQTSDWANEAKRTAQNAGQHVKDQAHAAGQKVSDMAHNAGKQAEDAASSVGGQLKSWGENLRRNAPNEGMMGSASNAVADTLERTGRYLEDDGLSGIANDLTNLIRRNPLPSLLIGIGLGFVVARAITRGVSHG